ncbi:probable inactive receptor kinase at5g10020 [Phtheirospermum japonicum]|uniref:Probable inactive receptor kinase at5g10020 n=1 Tax=Phtheirospermum japonicum TaxID=374723 RepID=A0A830C4S6_9LAMI|nr:probable inactive receptor kinase at5g10020 [Phtheirospermum japonicum]
MQPIICFMLLILVALAVGQSDIDALLELKNGIRTDNSGKLLVSWDSKSLASNGCPKDWYGITCSNGRVTSITLNDLGLSGEFNFRAISKLQMLRNLSVSNNQFTGTITKDVGSIGSLQSLDLSRNSFTGSIPSELTGLENLVLFNISSNNLEGEIPSGFDSFKVLKYLDFRSNGFVGDVMSLLGRLRAVVYVDLSCNMFSGSLDLGIGDPDFISSVRYLNISYNNLTGELFAHDGIPYFDDLEVFDASENRFVGNVPSFSFVVSLRVIKLQNNQLSGSLPEGLLQESSMVLSELDLSHNQLEGPIESITSLNLRNLNLSSNKLSGPLPARVGHCAVIDLSNNMFSGNLSRTQSWGNYIEIIELSSNQLTGNFLNQTSQFLRLTSLKISNNSLEGLLPPVLGTYPELKAVDFSLNRLTGFLLPTLFNSTKLADINLSFNNFSGPIPIEVTTAQNYNLISLNLSHNGLTGRLSPELSRFHSILYLDLCNNLFDGDIPDDLPETMMVFNVSYNNLSGVVPQSLQRFPSSSFHPGNNLLVVPNEAGRPEDGNDIVLRRHGSRMRSAMRAALIAGVVGGACVIAILTLLIYCRVNQEGRKANSTETGGKEGKCFGTVLFSSGTQAENIASAVRGPKDVARPESTTKTEVVPSPISMTSSENPSALSVCSPDKLAGDLHLFDSSLKFTPEELSSAPAEAVGMSCHGTLYKAVLSSGCVLAVKLLKEGIAKGRKEFTREAKKLGNIRHPNLVSLQGFYWGPKEHEKLIISKYIDVPCLALYLHAAGTDPRTLPPLSLPDRLKIALDVARCLTYLHTESAIPHGNLKSTNILIEIPNVNVLLTDYSLHRLLTSAGTAEQVLNAGALGYLPPEFTSTTKPCPSLKSDVYAFGVIILELLTGKSSADIIPGNPEVVDLSEWVSLMAAENRAVECFDSQILGPESFSKGLEAFLHIALKCILPADERPDMKMIFEELSSIVL